MLKNKPEVLAPAGNMSALKAAIAAGADACYLAGNSFGARAFAGNFNSEELLEAIYEAHLYGVKIYLTINTLLKDNEFKSLYDMLLPLYEAGLDSVLVQDMGVFDFVRKQFPLLPIHTSTQMNILTAEGAKLAKSLGASRIVAAREMTLEELKAIKKNADIEVEAFVHGAMCVCYSGRCLMSSMAGGRSGNRGCCAQPCRKMYNGSYKLSMRDMCTLRYIPEIIDAGIDSLKIEGRMKNEYYVAATVSAYKELVLDYYNGIYSDDKAERLEKKLLDVFNRGGFTSGYLMLDKEKTHGAKRSRALIDDSEPGRRGVFVGSVTDIKGGKISFRAEENINKGDELLIDTSESISITCGKDIKKNEYTELPAPETRRIKKNTSIYRTRNSVITQELDNVISTRRRVPVDIECVLKKDQPFELRVTATDESGKCVCIYGDIAEAASKNPITKDVLESKLAKLGESNYSLNSFTCDIDQDLFIPVSGLKRLRRQALESLGNELTGAYKRQSPAASFSEISKTVSDKTEVKELHISVSDEAQLGAVIDSAEKYNLKIDYLYLDMGLSDFSEEKIQKSFGIISNSCISDTCIVLAFPYVNRGDYNVCDILNTLFENRETSGMDIRSVYIRCIDDLAGVLRFISSTGDKPLKNVILGHSLYVYNSYAAAFYNNLFSEYGTELSVEASFEISEKTSDAILYPDGVKLIRPVYSRIPLMLTDALSYDETYLDDRKGSIYPVRYSSVSDYSVIYDSKPISLHSYINDISVCKYDFTIEDSSEIIDVLGPSPEYVRKKHFTIGHYEKGI